MGRPLRRTSHSPASPLPRDPGHGRISGLTQREGRTVQESLIAQMLEAIGLSFREQWLLRTAGESMVFDFLVEDGVLVECSQSIKRNCSNAWTTLWRRAIILNYKFRLAKDTGSFTTIALLEASHCEEYQHRALTPKRIANLTCTDYIVTSIPALGECLIEVINAFGSDPIPTWQAKAMERWVCAGKSRSRRKK